MRKVLLLFTGLFALIGAMPLFAQCNNVTLNWDYLDFFTYNSSYTSDSYIKNLAQAQKQHFAFGRQRLTIDHNYSADKFSGENSTHTAEAGSYGDDSSGADADLEFNGNGTITLTFEREVTNLKFSLYDVDRSQKVAFNARNAANVALPVVLNKLGGTSSIITIAGSNTTNATATANNNSVGNNSLNATFNVDIAGPVKSVVITITNSGSQDPTFWLSNITACTDGAFPVDYYSVSQPFTGQPGYVLHAFDKSVYAVNPGNGVTKLLFTDNYIKGNATSTNRWTINSMAYDPYRKILYYVYSLTDYESTNRVLKKYDFNTETISEVLEDVSTIGIPVTSISGVESGGACFYDGCLYLGIETSNSNRTSGREAVIWRIEFNESNVPYRASQAFALPVDGSGTLLHDWSDFVINNGVLYNFDGANANTSNSNTDVYHYNMVTGATVNYSKPTTFTPGQPTVGWNGQIYNVYAYASSPIELPSIAPYDPTTGKIIAAQKVTITSSPAYTPTVPSLGDAAEAFKPKADFGDAPASYDPDPLAPAVHETSPLLRLGATLDVEWSKVSSVNANGDGNDEDGLPFVRIINSALGVYYTDVTVFNNTGANATVAAWVDFNNNGLFDANEGVVQTVASMNSMQTIQVTWNNVPQQLPSNSTTYLRIRITSASNNLTTAKATGYMPDGEVEDYQVQVNVVPLAVKLFEFNAQKKDETNAVISWKTEEEPGALFILEKSFDEKAWNEVTKIAAAKSAIQAYNITDENAVPGKVTYRLKYIDAAGKINYSQNRTIWFAPAGRQLQVFPNPVQGKVTLRFIANRPGKGDLFIVDHAGRPLLQQAVYFQTGTNLLDLPFVSRLSGGIYQVRIVYNGKTYHEQIVVAK